MDAGLHSIFLVVLPQYQNQEINTDSIQKSEGNFAHIVPMMHEIRWRFVPFM